MSNAGWCERHQRGYDKLRRNRCIECADDYYQPQIAKSPLPQPDPRDAEIARLRAAITAVSGWRENDWPEWFHRRTAETIAEHMRVALEGGQ